MASLCYRRHRFPPGIIQHAIWLYLRFTLSADDVFVDRKHRRVYVSCGAGVVDVLESDEQGYRRLAHVPTIPGARTSLFVPELDRLVVAVQAESNEPAAIWVFRPAS